jgi:hypothetical protein
MKYLLTVLALTLVISCKDKKPDVVIEPQPTPVPTATPCPEGAVRNADGHCVIPAPVADFCDPKGKIVECEAQFSSVATKCRKFDGSDWAPSYFKDVPALDAYGKANGYGFYLNFRTPEQVIVGAQGTFPWHCKKI